MVIYFGVGIAYCSPLRNMSTNVIDEQTGAPTTEAEVVPTLANSNVANTRAAAPPPLESLGPEVCQQLTINYRLFLFNSLFLTNKIGGGNSSASALRAGGFHAMQQIASVEIDDVIL